MKKFRHRVALAAGGCVLVAGGLSGSGAAQAATPPAQEGRQTFTVKGCNLGVTAPVQRPRKKVRARAWSRGCANNWTLTAVLQSSRWWGWATDAKARWIGSGSRTLTARCAGIHNHRVILYWSSGPLKGHKIGPTRKLNCH